MLLRFRVTNHRSIRNEAELSLVSSTLRTATPPDGDWKNATLRVAAIYGANAAGKSTVLDAFRFALSAVRHSATLWAEDDDFPQHPFLLDEESTESPSEYMFDVVFDKVRYNYGFSSAHGKIANEWLYSYPNGRRKRLFERTDQTYQFGRDLQGENVTLSRATRDTALFLAVAANAQHPALGTFYDSLTKLLILASFTEGDQQQRMLAVKTLLATRADTLAPTAAVLHLADVGIDSVVVSDAEVRPQTEAAIKELVKALEKFTGRALPNAAEGDLYLNRKQLSFRHMDASGGSRILSEAQQSSGTLAWLALAIPALSAFRTGATLLVDELDASLHPRLSGALVAMFQDPAINASGAQLVFTTHDTSYLAGSAGIRLHPDEVWFVEKDQSGATQLFPLSDFPTRSADNFARRYLDGRYGAVPVIDLAELRNALSESTQ